MICNDFFIFIVQCGAVFHACVINGMFTFGKYICYLATFGDIFEFFPCNYQPVRYGALAMDKQSAV